MVFGSGYCCGCERALNRGHQIACSHSAVLLAAQGRAVPGRQTGCVWFVAVAVAVQRRRVWRLLPSRCGEPLVSSVAAALAVVQLGAVCFGVWRLL